MKWDTEMAEYVLVDRRQYVSRNRTKMWRLIWVNLDEFAVYEMTVDSGFDNYTTRGWRQIVHSDQPWGIYTGLRKTSKTSRDGYGILTADARAHLELAIVSQDEACELVMALQASN